MEAGGVSGDEGEDGEGEEDEEGDGDGDNDGDNDNEDEGEQTAQCGPIIHLLASIGGHSQQSRCECRWVCDGESRVVWRKMVLVWTMGDVVRDKGGRWERASRYGFCSRDGR